MPNYLSRMKPNGANGTEYKLKDEELREAFDVFKEDIKGTQTATGNPITLTDASETYAQGLSIELEPKQDLHGYDFPWVGGAGKNKLPLDLATIKSLNNTDGTWSGNAYTLYGVTFTVNTDDGGNVISIEVDGTPLYNIALRLCDKNTIPFLKSGSRYILNGCPSGGNSSTYCMTVGDNIIANYNDIGEGAEIPSDTGILSNNYAVWIYVAGSVSMNHKVFYPMISDYSETDSTFAPYSNICPITGYTECEVDDVGKNKFGGEYDQFFPLHFSSEVTLNASANLVSDGVAQIAYYDENKIRIDYWSLLESTSSLSNRIARTFTYPTTAYYVRFITKETTDYQIEVSSTNTPYEPYQSRTASVTFGQTVYGGKSDFTEGGTENNRVFIKGGWTQYASSNGFIAYKRTVPIPKGTLSCNPISNMISEFGTFSSGNMDRNIIQLLANNTNAYMALQENESADNVELCYEVAEPTTISTPPTDLKLLQDTNNLTTNGTTITLDYIPNNSIGDAVKASEEYTDRAVEGKADNTTAYVDLPGNYDTTNKNFPTRSATSGSVENCLIYINDLADKLYTAINSHATALANIPTKTVVVNHRAIDVGDEFNISLPLSYKFLIIELTIILTDELCYGSIVSTDFANGSVLSIVANGHGLSYWCDLSRMANTITVDGNFDSAHGELTITAF